MSQVLPYVGAFLLALHSEAPLDKNYEHARKIYGTPPSALPVKNRPRCMAALCHCSAMYAVLVTRRKHNKCSATDTDDTPSGAGEIRHRPKHAASFTTVNIPGSSTPRCVRASHAKKTWRSAQSPQPCVLSVDAQGLWTFYSSRINDWHNLPHQISRFLPYRGTQAAYIQQLGRSLGGKPIAASTCGYPQKCGAQCPPDIPVHHCTPVYTYLSEKMTYYNIACRE